MTNFKELLTKVKCFIFDMDGVLTNGTLLATENELQRTFNIRDGYALKEAMRADYVIAIITGGNSISAEKRFSKLGISEIYMGVKNKLDCYTALKSKYKLSDEEILYMGDDLPDYDVMKIVGVPTCPQDADHEIRAISKHISIYNGGSGCARDVIEQTMRLHGKWKLSQL